MPKKIIIYTIDYCPYCTNAKSLLQQQGIPFQEIFIDKNNQIQLSELMQKSGMRTFPMIFCNETVIGGFTELKKLHEEQGLKNVLL